MLFVAVVTVVVVVVAVGGGGGGGVCVCVCVCGVLFRFPNRTGSHILSVRIVPAGCVR